MSEWVTGRVVVRVGDAPLEVELTVPRDPVKPQRMLPVFQQMANKLVDLSVEAVERAGGSVSCKAGCGSCCRQPVPITEIEVYHIAELVEQMPEPRRNEIKRRFKAADDRFTEMNWYEKMREIGLSAESKGKEFVTRAYQAEAKRYFEQGIPCPFLENESCSIHESRPLACREYLVTSSPEHCAALNGKEISMIPLLANPSNALRPMARTGKMNQIGLLPLVRALELANMFPEEFSEKTGERWAAEFFQGLTGSQIPSAKAAQKVNRSRKPRPKRRKK